jgi:hypothetical protein
MVHVLNVNGTRGEITPFMHARMDTEFYQQGYAECLNTVITRYGPHTRVPGTTFYGNTKLQLGKAKFLAFQFSQTQVYNLEFGQNYVRFWTPDGQVFDGGAPYEVATIYTEADLPTLHGRQSGDAMYLFCKGKRPQVLRRMGETNWTITPYKPKDGPYLPINDTPTTLTPTHTGNVVPAMTSNNTFVGPFPDQTTAVASSSVGTDAWRVFSRNKATIATVGNAAGWVQIDLSTPVVMDNYFIISGSKNAETDAMFSQWDLQGSNGGSVWITLDSRDNEKGWAGSETRYYETNNKNAFSSYRLLFSGGSGSDPDHATTEMGGWYMHRAADNHPAGIVQASATTGINGGVGFRNSDVGRYLRMRGSDGRWRWGEIVAVNGTHQVETKMNGHALLTTDPIQDWALGAWSDGVGWPSTGVFYEDRFVLASWPDDPIGVAMSVSAAYDNFRTSDPLVDDDSIKLRLTGGRLDAIHWLADAGALMGGTGGGLRSIGGRDTSAVLKHDNVRQKLETGVAASAVQPVHVESVYLFMDSLRRRLYEMGYSYEADGYLAREVSVLNDHLFEYGINRTEFIDSPYRFVVSLRDDGKIVFFAYDREQKIAGGTLVDVGGFVEDICVLPGKEYPELWLIVRRERQGQVYRHVEKMAPFYNKRTHPNALPIYSTCSYTYEGAATANLANLAALTGQEVGVWADGRDIGNASVSNAGRLTLPQGISASRIVVGLRLPWRIKSLPLPTAQISQDGGGLSRNLRIVSITVDTFESARINAGGLNAVDLLRAEEDVEHDPDLPEPIRTKKLTIPADDGWKNEGVFVIEGSSMFPATIRGVSLLVEMEP